MNHLLKMPLAIGILLIAAHRLPAPISEVQETPAAPAKPKAKSKSAEPQSDAASKSAQRFDGTWTGSGSFPDQGRQWGIKSTLVISEGKRAVVIREVTVTPPPNAPWTDLPAPQNVGPLSYKMTQRTTDFKVVGSDLTVRWSSAQVSDLASKEISSSSREPLIKSIVDALAKMNVSVYTLRGDELTRENDPSSSKISYKRVK